MNIQIEVHSHTNICQHAYSTILESVQCAKELGLRGVAITDHGPQCFDGASLTYFHNMDLVSREMYGVRIIKGVEANILNRKGEIDIPPDVLQVLEWVIASIHTPDFKADDFDACTSAYLGVLENPYVDMLGHTGRGNYCYDHEKVIKRAVERNKVIEFNEHTFDVGADAAKRCLAIANVCKKQGAFVCLGSDAHFAGAVGKTPRAALLLKEVDYPKERILNLNADRFFEYLAQKKTKLKSEEER
ncbi:MAG: phosphatase [Oscillospiraceae bacterium]